MNLVGADLAGARLADADLTRTDLRGADLTRADLRGADLTAAKWPTTEPVPDGWVVDSESGRLQRAGGLSEVTVHYLR